MADNKYSNYLIKKLTEDSNLQDWQFVYPKKMVKIITFSQELYKEKSNYDKK